MARDNPSEIIAGRGVNGTNEICAENFSNLERRHFTDWLVDLRGRHRFDGSVDPFASVLSLCARCAAGLVRRGSTFLHVVDGRPDGATGLPSGRVVAIDMLIRMLPLRAGEILSFILLIIALGVLIVALPIGWGEVTGFSSKFATASLYYPDFQGGWEKVPRFWMMWSLLVCVILLLTVNIELMLRSIITFLGGGEDLRPIPGAAGAD